MVTLFKGDGNIACAVFAALALLATGAGATRDGTPNTGPLQAIYPVGYLAHWYFLPALDYDTDSCYNVAAIDWDGNLDRGLPSSTGYPGDYARYCRDEGRLTNSNVYARGRCNNGWCVYMYAYYFEKDDADLDIGHRYDWEHIALWANYKERDSNGYPVVHWVSISQHTGWQKKRNTEIRWQGSHPKVVYHKDGITTHDFRFATANDEPPENHKHQWQTGALLSYWKMSETLRNKLANGDFGAGNFKLPQGRFESAIINSKPSEIATFDATKNAPECEKKMEETGYC